MRNRDYYSRPIQSGGRSAHDYGRTTLTPDQAPRSDRVWIALIVLAVLWFAGHYV